MSGTPRASIMLVAAALFCGSACAMSSQGNPSAHCRVIGGDKLPAESGGAAALCSEIERAMAARLPGAEYRAEVRVLSASRLSATMVADGRALPEQHLASMDRDVNRASFERFATVLAEQVAAAGRAK